MATDTEQQIAVLQSTSQVYLGEASRLLNEIEIGRP